MVQPQNHDGEWWFCNNRNDVASCERYVSPRARFGRRPLFRSGRHLSRLRIATSAQVPPAPRVLADHTEERPFAV